MNSLLDIQDLRVTVEGKEIIKGVSLKIAAGEKHALMGPNGSGKSTLAYALMGHPSYKLSDGRIFLNGEDITSAPPDERARKGLFLALQYPVAVPGVTVAAMLRSAVKARVAGTPGEDSHPDIRDFRKTLREAFQSLGIDWSFATRYINDGFSGGEKKKLEILQMAVLRPSIALLDEPDSGLDVDALRIVARALESAVERQVGIMLITHYQRLLTYMEPDFVHVLIGGRIARSGGPEIARKLEETGYDPLAAESGAAAGPGSKEA